MEVASTLNFVSFCRPFQTPTFCSIFLVSLNHVHYILFQPSVYSDKSSSWLEYVHSMGGRLNDRFSHFCSKSNCMHALYINIKQDNISGQNTWQQCSRNLKWFNLHVWMTRRENLIYGVFCIITQYLIKIYVHIFLNPYSHPLTSNHCDPPDFFCLIEIFHSGWFSRGDNEQSAFLIFPSQRQNGDKAILSWCLNLKYPL